MHVTPYQTATWALYSPFQCLYSNVDLQLAALDKPLFYFYFFYFVAQLCWTLCNLMDCPWNSPHQNTGVGSLSLLQRIFPTQGSNPDLPHCRWILYQLSHKGSPRILEWVAYPFSRGSSWPRNRTRVSCIAGGYFTNWAIREAPCSLLVKWKLQIRFWDSGE